MFGSKKTRSQAGMITLVARSARIEGTVRYTGELDIEGVVAGDIYAEDDNQSVVKVLEGGRVEGEVRAPQVIINGHVSGDVFAHAQLYLAGKAVVEGNVHYRTIEMEKGAQIDGKLVHLEEGDTAFESVGASRSKSAGEAVVSTEEGEAQEGSEMLTGNT